MLANLSVIILLVCAVIFSIGFFTSIWSIENLRLLFSQPTNEQINSLLLIIACLIFLFGFLEKPVKISKLERILEEQNIKLQRIRGSNSTKELNPILYFLVTASYCSVIAFICLISSFIFLIDLFGGFQGTLTNIPGLYGKITLLVLGVAVLGYVFFRSKSFNKMKDLLEANNSLIDVLIQSKEKIQVLTREQAYAHMYAELDQITKVYVTTFEEPGKRMGPEGYYYEQEFMKKWYRCLKDNSLEAIQLILVNSKKDFDGMEVRLEKNKNIEKYYLSCIVAPPLTVFADMWIAPGKWAYIGLSVDVRNPSLTSHMVVLGHRETVKLAEDLFTNILLHKAIHIKTIDGINKAHLNKVKNSISTISRTRSKIVKELFPELESEKMVK